MMGQRGSCRRFVARHEREVGRQFHADMVLGADRLKDEIGYKPIRFMQMVSELGGLEAARHLLRRRDASDGFTTLWEHGHLGLSVEAFAFCWPGRRSGTVCSSVVDRRAVVVTCRVGCGL